MVTVKTKKGEFTYTDFQWKMAWAAVFLSGVMMGSLLAI
jgi:hypothetical protein